MVESSASRSVAAPAEVFVVVAAYNEAPVIQDVVRGLREEYPNVVVVDDGSTDRTDRAVATVATFVLRHPVNCGQGAALQTGIEFALRRGAKYVVTFDADGQHRVEDINAMVAPIAAGECDVTLGSRFLGSTLDLPRRRRLALRLGVWFTRWVNGLEVTDAHNGLRAFSRRAAERIQIRMDRMAHASEIMDQIRTLRLTYREVPVQVRYTEYSLHKGQSVRGAFRILVHYLIGRVVR